MTTSLPCAVENRTISLTFVSVHALSPHTLIVTFFWMTFGSILFHDVNKFLGLLRTRFVGSIVVSVSPSGSKIVARVLILVIEWYANTFSIWILYWFIGWNTITAHLVSLMSSLLPGEYVVLEVLADGDNDRWLDLINTAESCATSILNFQQFSSNAEFRDVLLSAELDLLNSEIKSSKTVSGSGLAAIENND